MYFWSIKGVYILQNAKSLNFKLFLDALASLDFKLSVGESVSNLPFFFFKYLVNQVMQVTKLIQDNQVICESTFKSFRFVQRAEKLCYPRFSTWLGKERNCFSKECAPVSCDVFYWDWCLDWEVTLCATLEFGPLGVAKGVCPSATRNGDPGELPRQIGVNSQKQILRGFMANRIEIAETNPPGF